MKPEKKRWLKTRQDFLLSLFPDKEEKYAVLKMNGFVLVRQFNGNTKDWQVAIYREEKYEKARVYQLEQKALYDTDLLAEARPPDGRRF